MPEETRRRPVVLLLEDEPQLTKAMCLNFEREFEIETAATADEALMLLASRQFDALLCDHMLPGRMQGLEFLVTAMKQQPAAKRILMTGYMNPDLLSRGVPLAELSALLLKPATVQQIRKALHDALGLSA
ncbi:MAG: response regulator [Candidatus Didemnitutus sp.]|jgi:CheY-like chemotaxis protein|nr:response regulator [Candidatus Didemnitutus sp.]